MPSSAAHLVFKGRTELQPSLHALRATRHNDASRRGASKAAARGSDLVPQRLAVSMLRPSRRAADHVITGRPRRGDLPSRSATSRPDARPPKGAWAAQARRAQRGAETVISREGSGGMSDAVAPSMKAPRRGCRGGARRRRYPRWSAVVAHADRHELPDDGDEGQRGRQEPRGRIGPA
jgi:hypothetical protein